MSTELHTSRLSIEERGLPVGAGEANDDPFLSTLLKGRSNLPEARLTPFAELRTAATARLEGLHLPTVRDEDWRFANLKPLRETAFELATEAKPLTLDQIGAFLLPEATNSRLVFVNGVFAPQLSMVSDLHSGVVIQNLQDAGNHAERVAGHLGRLALGDAFTTLNSALAVDGALVLIPRETSYQTPIHLLFIGVPGDRPVAAHPRVLVVAEAGSEATLVEDFVSLGEGAVLTNSVTEVVLAEDAKLTHVRLQRENLQTFHLGRSVTRLAHTATYRQDAVTLGGRFSRHEPVVIQDAEGIDATLNGLIFIGDGQFADTHSTLDHATRMGTSHQVHKCVLDGNARAVFNGKILVRKGALVTNSSQQSRNLLLSGKAKIDTKPQLEIFADDVRCAHGATVGQLDPDEVFYLVSRGLSERDARNLLTYAFAAEVLDRIPLASLRDALRTRVMAQVPGAK